MKQLESDVRTCPLAAWPPLLRRCAFALALGGLVGPLPLSAQDTRRAEASRAELQATLVELEQYIASTGYSGRLRGEKRREAELIRARLAEGDLQVGDQIDLLVVGEQAYTGLFPVVTGRVISLPGLPDVPLKGVLRSEARDYLTARLSTYIRDPQIRVRTTIRLSVFGSVGKPGFFQIPADVQATDAFMLAGGPAGDANPNKAFVRRGGDVIWSQEAFRDAMQKGLTLDQLNLRAGDELVLDPRKRPGGMSFYTVIGAMGALSTMIYFVQRIIP